MNPENQHPPHAVFQRCDLCDAHPYALREYIVRTLWNVVQATVFRWSPRRGHRWRALLIRCFGGSIGVRTLVDRSVQIMHPWLLSVGDWSTLAAGVVVYNPGPIVIGNHTVVSQGSFLCSGTHDYTRADLPLQRPPIRIGSGVWIAMQAFIGPGVTIGDNTVIGARSVVASDTPANVVAMGNPARIIKRRLMLAGSTAAAPAVVAE